MKVTQFFLVLARNMVIVRQFLTKNMVTILDHPVYSLKAGYTLIAKYAKTGAKCEKQKVYSGVFCVIFL